MEKIKETTYITKYKAIDGTIFISEDECRKYESSAKGVVSWRFRKLIISDEYNAWDLLGGDDDHVIFAVEVKSLEDIDVVLHFLFMENSWLLSGSDASNKRKAFIEAQIRQCEIWQERIEKQLALHNDASDYLHIIFSFRSEFIKSALNWLRSLL